MDGTPRGYEVRCMCGWTKDGYKNPVAACMAWEAHLKYSGCGGPNYEEHLIKGMGHQEKFKYETDGDTEMPKFTGKTEDSNAPILGARYWEKGIKLSGIVFGKFKTENGDCYNIKLDKPITISGSILKPTQEGKVTLEQMSIGAMSGFNMALRAAGLSELLPNDKIIIECTGTSPTLKGNDMVNFRLEIDRKDDKDVPF